jgi:hypothetical protein
MSIRNFTSFLLVLTVVMLLSCIPFPYTVHTVDAPDPDKLETQLQELQSSTAGRSTVIEVLGRPLLYRQEHISYEACKDIHGIAIIYGFMYWGDGFTAHESDLQCFELRIDFDEYDKMKGYRKLPRNWKHDEHEEDLTLKELGKQGDAIAQRLWERSRTYYTSQDQEIVEERIQKEQERQEQMASLSTDVERRAEAGDSEAQYQLFFLKDRKPVKWLCRSADQGNVNARMQIAYLYRSGASGFPQDYIRSYVWYRLSGLGEHKEKVDELIIKLNKKPSFWNPIACSGQTCQIATELVQLQSLLTPAGITQAEQMLENWQPGQCESYLMDVIPEINE